MNEIFQNNKDMLVTTEKLTRDDNNFFLSN